jgi:hypothetical protein
VINFSTLRGECYIRHFGGEWCWDPQAKEWCVSVKHKSGRTVGVMPFNHVNNHLLNGWKSNVRRAWDSFVILSNATVFEIDKKFDSNNLPAEPGPRPTFGAENN